MKVSVLVAVYNAEKYLSICLDSLIGQTHRDLQIICVDDASTDESWQILENYAAMDSRIVLLKQTENRGQAEARNRGLQVADGEFVTMLDSDDWFSPDALEKACELALEDEKNDCILFDVNYYDDATAREWGYEYRTADFSWEGPEAFRLSLDWSIHGLYMVRRAIHEQYPYDTTCRLYSDDNTTRLHYLHSRQVVRCGGVYYYRQHAQSMTHAITPLRFLYLDANYSMKQILLAENVADNLVNQYEEHRWRNLVGLYIFYWANRKEFSIEERSSIRKKLRYYYSTVEVHRLSVDLKRKFGYMSITSSVRLYEIQNYLYMVIRRMLYHLRGKNSPEEMGWF